MQIYKDYAQTTIDAQERRARYIDVLLNRGWNAVSALFRSTGKSAMLPKTEAGRRDAAHGLPAS